MLNCCESPASKSKISLSQRHMGTFPSITQLLPMSIFFFLPTLDCRKVTPNCSPSSQALMTAKPAIMSARFCPNLTLTLSIYLRARSS